MVGFINRGVQRLQESTRSVRREFVEIVESARRARREDKSRREELEEQALDREEEEQGHRCKSPERASTPCDGRPQVAPPTNLRAPTPLTGASVEEAELVGSSREAAFAAHGENAAHLGTKRVNVAFVVAWRDACKPAFVSGRDELAVMLARIRPGEPIGTPRCAKRASRSSRG